MKQLLEKLLKFIEIKKNIANQDYYIVEYNKLPILIPKSELVSSINRTYVVSRDKRYLDIPVDLKSKEMLRAEAKQQSAQEKSSTGD